LSVWAAPEAAEVLQAVTLFLSRSLHTLSRSAERGGHRVPSPPFLPCSWLWALPRDTSARRPVPAGRGKGSCSGQLACSG